jgi:hypothetical protein
MPRDRPEGRRTSKLTCVSLQTSIDSPTFFATVGVTMVATLVGAAFMSPPVQFTAVPDVA